MIRRTINIILLFAVGLVVVSCYYDNEVDLYGVDDCDSRNVSYIGFVQPVIQQNCNVCHSTAANSGGVTLEGYDALKTYVDNGRLIGAITHTSGFSPMPQGAPQLPACTLEKIQAWVTDGALNN